MQEHNYISEFSIPFFQYKINDWDIKKSLLLELYKKIENNIAYCFEKDKTSSVYTDFYKNGNYQAEVLEILSQEINEFISKINFKNPHLTNAWFQKYNKNNFHTIHNHGSTGYSSVCFIEYDSKYHSPTRFICPFNDFLTGNVIEFTPKNVDEGTIIFFPSSILHYTSPNNSDFSRIILSFNINNR